MPTSFGASPGLYDTDAGGQLASTASSQESNVMKYELMKEENDSEQYLASRVEAVQGIERTIQELSTMYQRVAIMVSQQEEQTLRYEFLVDLVESRLDMTIDDTVAHTENAHAELSKYYEWVQSNRWLMLKIFAILIFFAVIFVIFIQ